MDSEHPYLHNLPQFGGVDPDAVEGVGERVWHVERPGDQHQLPVVLLEDDGGGLRHGDLPEPLLEAEAGPHGPALVPEEQSAARHQHGQAQEGGQPGRLGLPPLNNSCRW